VCENVNKTEIGALFFMHIVLLNL